MSDFIECPMCGAQVDTRPFERPIFVRRPERRIEDRNEQVVHECPPEE